MALEFERQLSPERLSEVGSPTGAFARKDRPLVAFAGEFKTLFWPARAAYAGHRLRHRVTLYSRDLSECVGVMDAARFPIHEVALHATRPLAAIATGAYDGGWMFQGELLLWDWETDAVHRVLSCDREVTRARFDPDGALWLLMRALDEEDSAVEGDPFKAVLGACLTDLRPHTELGLVWGADDPRLADLRQVEPAELGFDSDEISSEEHLRRWNRLLGEQAPERRDRVWDLDWSEPARVLAVHDDCLVEGWTPKGERVLHVEGAGSGVQLLRSGGRSIVHGIEVGPLTARPSAASTLYALEGDELGAFASFDHPLLASVDRRGRILCRDVGEHRDGTERADRILEPGGETLWSGDLGHYDCFNHHLRLDGGDGPTFLRGTPAGQHESKVLCAWTDGEVRERFPWDTRGDHMLASIALFTEAGVLVRGFEVYDPSPESEHCYLEGLDETTGELRWRHATRGLPTALERIGEDVAFTTAGGQIGLVRPATGDLRWEAPLRVDGVDSIGLSLASNGERLACGTVEGRILLFRVRGA